ncbi:MAG: hypothetical protein JO222_01580 [Frankiales bacterium]|nr:hypothetical protein [Frankiales bacterium]
MRVARGDDGSVVMALLALLVVTGILVVGLAAIVRSQVSARHDVAFESALTGAEQGLDELVAQVKANPTATSFSPVTGTTTQGVSYSATVAAASGGWLVNATGTATSGDRTVTRHVQATVNVGDLLSLPLFGKTALSLGSTGSGASAVDRYDSSVSSDVCLSNGTHVSMGVSDTRMCTEASPARGDVATDGTLTMKSSDLNNIATAHIFDVPVNGSSDPDATGKCGGDAGVCAAVGGQVDEQQSKLDFPLSNLCANGIGGGTTAFTGSTALAANAVYNFSDVTLNATAIANLGNVSGSQIVICFNGTLTVPPLVPLNSTVSPTNPLLSNPRAPSTLLLISTATSGAAPVVNFGLGSSAATSLSAVIYAPNANCTANGHVDVYGLLVCGSVTATGGLDVHYDTQISKQSFDRPVTVAHWREVTGS